MTTPTHIQEWIDALRSGVYDQGRYRMKNDKEQYCCLGVYCSIHGMEPGNEIKTSLLHDFCKEKLGEHIHSRAIVMNDHLNQTFSEIADFVESCYLKKEHQQRTLHVD